MTAKRLDAAAVGLPRFEAAPDAAAGTELTLFDLSSHSRARQALRFGLGIDSLGFNIFVLGEDRSGRMTATLEFLENHVQDLPPPSDWVYLNNFTQPSKPRPYRLPHGVGRRLRDRMNALVPALTDAIKKTLESPEYAADLEKERAALTARIDEALQILRARARERGLDVQRTPQGLAILPVDQGQGARPFDQLSDAEKVRVAQAMDEIRDSIRNFNIVAFQAESELTARVQEIRRQVVDGSISPLLDSLERDFGQHSGLGRWLVQLRMDILDNMVLFLPQDPNQPRIPGSETAEERYAVNLIVDNSDTAHAPVVLEPNPGYENLFGTIEYRAVAGVMQTNFTMIRAGALHRANGGILVVRAEAVAEDRFAWESLKGALRDSEIRIEERHRQRSVPVTGAPQPYPIPLQVKAVIVGAPRWYYTFFSLDPNFVSQFKVKADIDADLEATPDNLAAYRALIRQRATLCAGRSCKDDAVTYLMGQSARWAGHREKLTARFELLEDILNEAGELAAEDEAVAVTAAYVKRALDERRQRNARLEDRSQEHIRSGVLMIDTEGAVVGQINALTVRHTLDHAFGQPVRVTARTFVGKLGVINIERAAALGGPIQQKGVMVIGGFLNGHFARKFPLSFSASITFEQSYEDVEGDSASMAELCAVLSSLADVPIRQDLAITGSVNQLGLSQAIGGANEKIEGFYRTCAEGGLNGNQGVIVPAANEINVVLRDKVAEAVEAGTFRVWSVRTVDETLELMTGVAAGTPDADGRYPPDTVFGRVLATLESYDRILSERGVERS